jgi:hypothetical protein
MNARSIKNPATCPQRGWWIKIQHRETKARQNESVSANDRDAFLFSQCRINQKSSIQNQ